MFDSTLGRFLQRDPWGHAAGDSNVYRYAWDSSTNYADPLGWLAVTLSLCWDNCRCPEKVMPTNAEIEQQFKQDFKKVLGQDVTVNIEWTKAPCYYKRYVDAKNAALKQTREAYNKAVDEFEAANTPEEKAAAQKKAKEARKRYDEQAEALAKQANRAGVAKNKIGVDLGRDTAFGGTELRFGAPEQWVRVYAGYCESLTAKKDFLQYMVNVTLHEVGHLAGLWHRRESDDPTAAMRTDIADKEMAAWLKGPTEFNKDEQAAVRKYLEGVEKQK
jgi:hypothetical protein